MAKTAAELIAEANAAVDRIGADEAQKLVGNPDVVFLDVREPQELETQGKVPGAVHIPRGLLEFQADPASPSHRPELSAGKQVIVYCASGGRSALAAKTLKEMGVTRATNLLGGFNGWRETGGPVER